MPKPDSPHVSTQHSACSVHLRAGSRRAGVTESRTMEGAGGGGGGREGGEECGGAEEEGEEAEEVQACAEAGADDGDE